LTTPTTVNQTGVSPVRRIRCPTESRSGHIRAAADWLTMTLLFALTASSGVNGRPRSSSMPMTRK
jgi:hypothetical protein